ncbi:leucine--tRNA ligase, partial [Clostridium baratii]|uniref:leucine--tRNA ligase n=1 Tax=Clostridium baratii TaxID=1561 RepID=UPI002A76199A
MGNYGTAIDKKWQEKWEKEELYKFDPSKLDKKLYVLEMFSYPSGSQLHAGHWFNYGPVDTWARLKRMKGYNVFQPMGFDAFGLPAENYAIKTGVHPQDSTEKNIVKMEEQLKAMGAMFNWENEVVTCRPDYYKWTQWLFLKLYEKGLAYRKQAPVNWCPSCNTVLANEQVVDGLCERCDSEVTKKDLTQWFLKITDYADELLEKLDGLNWPEKTVSMQKHWIGKSTGAEVTFKVKDHDLTFDVFTTRVDTLCGVSYVVLAPENKLVDEIVTPENKAAIEAYKEETAKQSEIERQSISKEKTGVFTGAFAINPINGKEVPIWVGDYVLASYGTGAVMAVPAHDERDFAFATKFNLPINRVITPKDGSETELPYCEHGTLVNSGEFDGLTTEEAKVKIVEKLSENNEGSQKVNYRLRDWLVSRQRY